MFTPRWKKEAALLDKGAKKFLNYKRDLLSDERIAEIESRRDDLRQACKAGDRQKTEEAGKQLQNCCEKSIRGVSRPSALAENVEVLFVAFVIALGLRAYFLQPFKIPTNSMYPSLNGVKATSFQSPDEKKPWIGAQGVDYVLRGRTYYDITAKNTARLKHAEDASFFLFTRTKLYFDDGSVVTIGAPPNEVMGIDSIAQIFQQRGVKAGQTIFRGYLDTGDLVLVDKFSYNFRKPKRGEVFVFDTRGIAGIRGKDGGDQGNGSHYIKRLCGVPGDSIAIDQPNVIINGHIAQEPGMQRVARHEGPYTINPGYFLMKDSRATYLSGPEQPRTLRADAPQGLREYVALGDNTQHSFDSRFWGPVHEYNLVGPGLFTLWPITSGHWGFIK